MHQAMATPPDSARAADDDRREKMTLAEAASFCHVDYNTFHRWVVKGVLPHVLVGPYRSMRVYRRDVEHLIQPGDRR